MNKKGFPNLVKLVKTIANILSNGEILILKNFKISLKAEIKQPLFTNSIHWPDMLQSMGSQRVGHN